MKSIFGEFDLCGLKFRSSLQFFIIWTYYCKSKQHYIALHHSSRNYIISSTTIALIIMHGKNTSDWSFSLFLEVQESDNAVDERAAYFQILRSIWGASKKLRGIRSVIEQVTREIYARQVQTDALSVLSKRAYPM